MWNQYCYFNLPHFKFGLNRTKKNQVAFALAIADDFADSNNLSCLGITIQKLITSLEFEFEIALDWSDRWW